MEQTYYRNLFLEDITTTAPYCTPKGGGSPPIPFRDRQSHARFLKERFQQILEDADVQENAFGYCVTFTGQADCNLVAHSLEHVGSHVRLLNVKEKEIRTDPNPKSFSSDSIACISDSPKQGKEIIPDKATVFIPKKKASFFLKKIEEYETTDTSHGNPKNRPLIDSIADVSLADLSSFWMGEQGDIPTEEPMWCEVWLLQEAPIKKENNQISCSDHSFETVCEELGIPFDPHSVSFPESVVRLCKANGEQLRKLIRRYPYVSEIRKALRSASTYESMSVSEQQNLVDGLLHRVVFSPGKVSVCILDTGLNGGHPLLKPYVVEDGVLAWNKSWSADDKKGHGTALGGIALFGDLRKQLERVGTIPLHHVLESVKILPDGRDNDPELYGAITKQSVAKIEIADPFLNRILCMANTAQDEDRKDSTPSSWSGAVDALCANPDEPFNGRLFIESAGNVALAELHQSGYPDANSLHSVEDPGQAWNAITVGAFSNDVVFDESSYKNCYAVAQRGGLCPYSSTSDTWDKKWPIKPDVLFDGGNAITNGSDYSDCEYLNLLTTNHKPYEKLFTHLNATSAATGQAARMAARLQSAYPEAWPETIRALIIHSASWTNDMKQMFLGDDPNKVKKRHLLRMCGYGIPDYGKAVRCMANSVNLIIQQEIQPYTKGKESNAIQYHEIPWPKDVLKELGQNQVTMKVTLSYFIEPAPGGKGWKGKYRYPSCGLHFEVMRANETADDFKKRINKRERDDNDGAFRKTSNESGRWFLGPSLRDVGSVHSDSITASAVDFCDMHVVAVFPVIGWWKKRTNLGCMEKKVRYSLVVTLSTPETSVDFYTPITMKLSVSVKV